MAIISRKLSLRRARLARWLACLLAVMTVGRCWLPSGRLEAQETPAVPATSTQETPAAGKPQSPPGEDEAARDLMQLENLLTRPVEVPAFSQVVSTVSRQESTVGKSPAAVFVITNDMIRRTGATTIPEALRMVPGMNVARIDNANSAVSVRGFQDRFANKLLIQIDGRTVYAPIFAGVFWATQDLLLEDIERIEVIRGPGATVWGSNAVNGIVNVITKSAKDTQGGLATATVGTEERGIAGFRYGGQVEDNLSYRVWGKWREMDHGFHPAGEAREDWRSGRGGFRMDWTATETDTVTLQGELSENREGLFERQSFPTAIPPAVVTSDRPFTFIGVEDRRLTGAHILSRWSHTIDDDSDWRLQTYFDNSKLESVTLGTDINTFDVDFQHRIRLHPDHQFIYGFGQRVQEVSIQPSSYTQFGLSSALDGFRITGSPAVRELNYFSTFLQDQMTLVDDQWFFTIGSKFEHNEYTDFNYQPSSRLLWTPTPQQTAWASVSRAVRTPSLSEAGLISTTSPAPGSSTFSRRFPNSMIDNENLIAYELGYRAQPHESFSWDIATFFNDYTDLAVNAATGPAVAGPPSFVPTAFQNRMQGESYGVELSGNLEMTEQWRLYAAYSFLRMQLHADDTLSAAARASAEGVERQSPRNQIYLWSSWDLPHDLSFDVMGRYVDQLSGFATGASDTPVASYIEMDVRLGWKPSKNIEWAVVGQNLLDGYHKEFGTNPRVGRPLVEAQRGVFGTVAWRF